MGRNIVDTVCTDANERATEKYYKGIAEVLAVMPERVIRHRVPDLTVSYCNAAWAAGHGLVPDDVIGHQLDEFLSVEELEGLESQLALLSPSNPVLADDVARPASRPRPLAVSTQRPMS